MDQQLEQLPAEIQKAVDRLDAMRAKVVALVPDYLLACEAKDAFPDVIYQIDIYTGSLITSVDVGCAVDTMDQAAEVLHWFGQRERRQTMKPFTSVRERVYTLGNIEVRVGFRPNGPCRMVKVGVREEPVYEVQCDGQPVAEPEGVGL